MELPSTLGPYRVLRRLGVGGMAEVFLARAYGASNFEKPVALKVLREELRSDPELLRLLVEEARLGGQLSHRNLIGVHELGLDRGIYYVRMDYVDGADLATLRREGPLPVPVALYIAEELAAALAYVHVGTDEAGRPLGLVHRDVSPHNVLVSRAGEVKLGDFGIAKATRLQEQTHAGLRRGKYAYMSPEQVRAAPLSAQSDQFSLGVVLFELLTGARPFDGNGPLETMERIRAAPPPDTSGIDEDVAQVLLRCLARSPDERFSSTEDLLRAVGTLRQRRTLCMGPELGRWVTARIEGPVPTQSRESLTRPTRPLTE